MKTLLACLLVIAPTVILASGFEDYKTSTFAAVTKGEHSSENPDYDLHPGTQGWIVRAEFTGRIRPIAEQPAMLVRYWSKMTRGDESVSDYFKEEIELVEGEQHYWVPIQHTLVEPLRNEVRPGAEAAYYVLFLGFFKETPLFVINEFRASAGE